MGMNRKRKITAYRARLQAAAVAGVGLAACGLGAQQAQAAYSFTSLGQTITESFTNYTGTAAPANWSLTPTNLNATTLVNYRGNGTNQTFNGTVGPVTGSGSGGYRAYGYAANTADRSLGIIGNGGFGNEANTNTFAGGPANLTASFTNNTGSTITSLVIGYTGEQWVAQASRASFMTVQYSTDGVSFSSNISGLTFNAPNTTALGSDNMINGKAAGNRTVFTPVNVSGLNIAAGNTFYVRFQYTGNNAGSGSRQGLGIDDVNVTAEGSGPVPATVTWATTTGTWDTTTGNWTGGSPTANLYKGGDTAVFANIASDSTITVAAGIGGADAPAATNITNAANTYTFVGGAIGGSGALTKSGAGTAVLSVANTYSGGTTVSGGTLVADGGDDRLGSASGSLTLNGGTLRTDTAGLTSARDLIVGASGGTFNSNGLNSSTSGATTLTGTLTKTGTGDLALNGSVAPATTGRLDILAGSVTLGQASGTVTFANGATVDGTLVIANPVRVNFNDSTKTYGGTGSIQVQDSGTLLTNQSGQTAGTVSADLALNSTNVAFTKGDVSAGTYVPGTFVTTIGGTSGATGDGLVISGVLSGDSDVNFSNNSTTGGGTGNIRLNAANTYTGTTVIDAGTGAVIRLGVNDALPTGSDVIAGTRTGFTTPTLDLNGFHQQVASLSDGPSVGVGEFLTITNNGATTSTLTVGGTTTPANAFSGIIQDGTASIDLVKTGSNTVTFSGVSPFTGTTVVDGGQLVIASTGNLSGTSAITINSGGTLTWNSTSSLDATLLTLESGGTLSGGGSLTGNLTVNGVLSGTSTLAGAVAGSGAIDPGNSPGIVTVGQVDTTGGLDFNFEFTATGAPDYGTPAASINDVLRITNLTTPFIGTMDGDNLVNIYLNVTGLADGDVFQGGWYADQGSDFLATIAGGSFSYYVYGDGSGTHTYNSVNYYTLAEYNASASVTAGTVAQVADFGGGPISGRVTQFSVVVPEPGTLALLSMGSLAVLRRRRSAAKAAPATA